MYKYSKRLLWSVSPNRFSRLVEDRKNSELPLLDLTVANPTAASFYPHSEIQKAFSQSQDGRFQYDPDPLGLKSCRASVTRFYSELGFEVGLERIALTASTSEAYAVLFKLLCDAGDEVLIPTPSYPLFEYLAALENLQTVAYRLQYDGSWFIDFDDLKGKISPRSRAIVIVNPNNPTGSFLKQREKQKLVELALESHIPIISDEVFMPYEFGQEAQRVRTLVDEDALLTFSLNGLSKAAGMPQMKLAWIVINGPEREQRIARERLEMILDTYLSVNIPVQVALERLLKIGAGIRSELLARAKRNLLRASQLLENSPVHVLYAEGGWSVILRLPCTLPEETWVLELLQRENILLQPGFFFDIPTEAYAVASLITEPAVFDEGLAGLRRFVMGVC